VTAPRKAPLSLDLSKLPSLYRYNLLTTWSEWP